MANNPYVNKVQLANGTTLIDLSTDTAVASDVAQGKYFHLSTGERVQGTASGGGGEIIITDEPNATGTTAAVTADDVTTLIPKSITQNGTYDPEDDNADGYSSVTVNVSGGSPSVTQHSIYFEFSDSTSTTIPVYYDDSLLGTMITAYTPETYGAKTVDLAQLDGVTWYERPTETWETVYNNTTSPNADTPYNYWWLSSLSDVYPTVGSVWRVTIDNTQWVLTARQISGVAQGAVFIGNPKYSGGQDDGSGVTTNFYNAGWGAWVGDTEISTLVSHTVKIERRVSA